MLQKKNRRVQEEGQVKKKRLKGNKEGGHMQQETEGSAQSRRTDKDSLTLLTKSSVLHLHHSLDPFFLKLWVACIRVIITCMCVCVCVCAEKVRAGVFIPKNYWSKHVFPALCQGQQFPFHLKQTNAGSKPQVHVWLFLSKRRWLIIHNTQLPHCSRSEGFEIVGS